MEIQGRTPNMEYVNRLKQGITPAQACVKFVTPGSSTITGYTFLWGSPTLTDAELEYFLPSGDYWDGKLSREKMLCWDHNQDKSFDADCVIGKITDWGDDKIGRWYAAKLDTAHRYHEAIARLIDDGILGTSSDSIPQYIVREKRMGATWLKTWPWIASALTDQPAEPRMVGSINWLKRMGYSQSTLEAIRKSRLYTPASDDEILMDAQASLARSTANKLSETQILDNQVNEMSHSFRRI